MATITWSSGISGNWDAASDWSTDTVPGSGDDVTIAASGAYTVTVSDAEAAHSLTTDAAGVTINDSGTLTITTTLTVSSGTFALNSGGTVAAGTLSAPGGVFDWNGGTLSGVTFDGTLDLSANYSDCHLANGLTMAGVERHRPRDDQRHGLERLPLFRQHADLRRRDDQSRQFTYYYAPSYLYENDVNGAGNQVLTLGPGVTIDVQGYARNFASSLFGRRDRQPGRDRRHGGRRLLHDRGPVVHQ